MGSEFVHYLHKMWCHMFAKKKIGTHANTELAVIYQSGQTCIYSDGYLKFCYSVVDFIC